MSSTATRLSSLSTASKVNVAAMATAIVAIVIQIAAGVDYPPIPPGPILLAVAIGLVVCTRKRWALVVAIVVPLFLVVGGTIASIASDENALHVVPFVATAIQMAVVVVAFAAGLRAYREQRS